MRQHSEGKRTRPLPLVWFTTILSSKTFQWNVLDVLYFERYTKAVALLLLERFSLAEPLPFEAIASKFPLQSASKHALRKPNACVWLRSRNFALCGGRFRGFAPKNPTKGSNAPFGNPRLGYCNCSLNPHSLKTFSVILYCTNRFKPSLKSCANML